MTATYSDTLHIHWPKGWERFVLEGDHVEAGQVLARSVEDEEESVAPFAGVVVASSDGFAAVQRKGKWPPR